MVEASIAGFLDSANGQTIQSSKRKIMGYVTASEKSKFLCRHALLAIANWSESEVKADLERLFQKKGVMAALEQRNLSRWARREHITMRAEDRQLYLWVLYLLYLWETNGSFADEAAIRDLDMWSSEFSLEELKSSILGSEKLIGQTADDYGDSLIHSRKVRKIWIDGVRGTLRCDENVEHLICRDFFRKSASAKLKEQSYYLVYRYSKRGDIAKSFLAISTPADNDDFDYFSFIHGFNFKTKEGPENRISHGAMLASRESYYFVGGTRVIDSARVSGPIKPDLDRSVGCKFIAVPQSNFDTQQRHRMLAGLYMSHSADGHPIAGRLAMIHIGFRSDLRTIYHDEVLPGIIPAADVGTDLAKTFIAIGLDPLQESQIEEYEKFILENIDNNPEERSGAVSLTRALYVGRDGSVGEDH